MLPTSTISRIVPDYFPIFQFSAVNRILIQRRMQDFSGGGGATIIFL